MSTVIYSSPIFGPVRSRRFGISLGINLLPGDGKVCSFDCVYCECGFNRDHRPQSKFPTREEVREALRDQLLRMKSEGCLPDVLTFAGNGEPTCHPHFPEIINDVTALRDELCPECKITVLSNATMIHKEEIRRALMKTDNNCQKLDTVCDDFIRRIDRPLNPAYSAAETVENLCKFEGKVVIQTMFLTSEGIDADNTTDAEAIHADNTSDAYVLPWLEALQRIRPQKVMIYTIDRETPDPRLRKASPEVLDSIAAKVRALGLECSVSY